jgi:hypothetical protein
MTSYESLGAARGLVRTTVSLLLRGEIAGAQTALDDLQELLLAEPAARDGLRHVYLDDYARVVQRSRQWTLAAPVPDAPPWTLDQLCDSSAAELASLRP